MQPAVTVRAQALWTWPREELRMLRDLGMVAQRRHGMLHSEAAQPTLACRKALCPATTHQREQRVRLHELQKMHLTIEKRRGSNAAATEVEEANLNYFRAKVHGRGAPSLGRKVGAGAATVWFRG